MKAFKIITMSFLLVSFGFMTRDMIAQYDHCKLSIQKTYNECEKRGLNICISDKNIPMSYCFLDFKEGFKK